MTLYLYKIGTSIPTLTIEDVVSYTDNEVRTASGIIYGPFAADFELSATPDCSETLRAKWRREHCLADYPELMTLEEHRAVKLAELSAACNEVITSGFDIEFNGKAEHFNLSLADQNNIDSLSDLVKLGGTEFPYQADDGKCRIYTANEIAQIYIKSKTTITTQTTYHNALKEYVQGLDDVEAIAAVQYGMELPEPFASEVADKLDRASAQMSTVLAAMGGDGGAV